MELISPYEWDQVAYGEWRKLPADYGCYAFIQPVKGLIYIGRSKMLCNRLRKKSHHILKWLCESTRIAFNTEMYDHEKQLIQMYKPQMNIAYLK